MPVFIDFDGTLIDISERHYRCYVASLRACNQEPNLNKDQYWELKRSAAPWSQILKEFPLGDLRVDFFLNAFIERIEQEEYLDFDILHTGALEFIKHASTDRPLVLVSLRRSRSALLNQLAKLGLLDLFTEVLTGHSESRYETTFIKSKLISESGHQYSDSLIIGDSEADVLAAKILGVPSVAVSTGIRSAEYLQSLGPNYLFESLLDIESSNLNTL